MRFQSPLLLSCSLLALSPLILALPSPQQPGDYDAALRKAAADPPAQLGEYLKNATQTYVSILGNSWASTVNVASPEAREVTLPKQAALDLRNAIHGVRWAGAMAQNRGYIFQPDEAERAFKNNFVTDVYQQLHKVFTESLFVARASQLQVQDQIVDAITKIQADWIDAWDVLEPQVSDDWESEAQVYQDLAQIDQWFTDIIDKHSY